MTFPIPTAALDDRLAIVGTAGSGKTYLALGAIEHLFARKARVIAIDPLGEWNDERYARPVSLIAAGRAALTERTKYDMEPVFGGLVEPGWQAIPTKPNAEARP